MTTTAFSPNPKTVSLADGGEVRWVNQDGGSVYGGGTAAAHQIMSDDAAFDTSEPFSPGQSYTIILGRPAPITTTATSIPTWWGRLRSRHKRKGKGPEGNGSRSNEEGRATPFRFHPSAPAGRP